MKFDSEFEYDEWVEENQQEQILKDQVPIKKEVAERWLKSS